MLKLLLAASVVASAVAWTVDERTSVDPAAVKQAVVRLEAAFKNGDPAERIAALQASVELPDAELAKGVAKGLKDKDGEVVKAAVDALGRMQHTEALAQLEAYYRHNKKRLEKDEALFAHVLKSCARHGRESSIQLLSDDVFKVKSYEVLQARIYGLGNIRSKDSIEALIGMSRKTSRNNLDRYMDELRLALFHITGVDQGKSPDLWANWWREHHKTFEVSEEAPELPPEMRARWNRYWGLGRAEERKRRR